LGHGGGINMRKELLAAFCVLTMLAGTAPIFAADTTNTNSVVLTTEQLAKLEVIQTQVNELLNKITTLKTTYKSTKKTKGLLTALNQFEKQAKKLNTTVNNYKNNPTANADKKIKAFEFKTKQLEWKVKTTEKILKKITTPKTKHNKKTDKNTTKKTKQIKNTKTIKNTTSNI